MRRMNFVPKSPIEYPCMCFLMFPGMRRTCACMKLMTTTHWDSEVKVGHCSQVGS